MWRSAWRGRTAPNGGSFARVPRLEGEDKLVSDARRAQHAAFGLRPSRLRRAGDWSVSVHRRQARERVVAAPAAAGRVDLRPGVHLRRRLTSGSERVAADKTCRHLQGAAQRDEPHRHIPARDLASPLASEARMGPPPAQAVAATGGEGVLVVPSSAQTQHTVDGVVSLLVVTTEATVAVDAPRHMMDEEDANESDPEEPEEHAACRPTARLGRVHLPRSVGRGVACTRS